jgi:hypothetical protein
VARAVLKGTQIDELILLSAPVTNHLEHAAESGVPIVDVRLKFDPVLGLARARQRLKQKMKPRENVIPVVIDSWRLDHGASHSPHVWRTQEVAHKGKISALR